MFVFLSNFSALISLVWRLLSLVIGWGCLPTRRLTVDLSLVGQFGVQEWVTQDTLCYKPQTKLIRLPRTGGTSQ